jgi:hypothetical protein
MRAVWAAEWGWPVDLFFHWSDIVRVVDPAARELGTVREFCAAGGVDVPAPLREHACFASPAGARPKRPGVHAPVPAGAAGVVGAAGAAPDAAVIVVEDGGASAGPAPVVAFTFPPEGGHGAVQVLEADLARLAPDAWLNDTVIDFYLRWVMCGLEERRPAAATRCYVFNSFFYKKLVEDRESHCANLQLHCCAAVPIVKPTLCPLFAVPTQQPGCLPVGRARAAALVPLP